MLPFQDMQPTVLPFLGVHPTAPLFQVVQATAPVPIHQLRMSHLQHPFIDGIFYRGIGVQQIQDKGEKSQQIEQPTDIVTEPTGKMLTH